MLINKFPFMAPEGAADGGGGGGAPAAEPGDISAAEVLADLKSNGVDLFDYDDEDIDSDEPAQEAKADDGEEPGDKPDDKAEDKPAKDKKDDDEESEEDEPAKEEKKESTYQRNKRKLDEAKSESMRLAREKRELQNKHKELEQELEYWRKTAEQEAGARDQWAGMLRQGQVPEVESDAALSLRRENARLQAELQLERQRQEQAARESYENSLHSEKSRLQSQIERIATENRLGDAERVELLQEFVLLAELGRPEPIESVFRRQHRRRLFEQASISDAQVQQQIAASASAPTIKTGAQPRVARQPSAEDDAATIASWLQAEGLV